ncbi:MAG TPA: Crp/Fnr family transcriptional regulator [Rhizomicrobium sp.]|jgi:CRP-like cAMP-binding protein|nr:Crp/Fnr family transcriptional regulator [Rhizomicrobium sp.]
MERWRALGLDTSSHADLLVRRLSHLADLSPKEKALLESIAQRTEEVPAGTELIREGEALNSPRLLMAGWACRFRTLPDGRRQIFEFILPGDIYGLCLRPQAVALTTSLALTPVVIADAALLGTVITSEVESHPGLTQACYATASLDEAYLLNQLMRVGRQTAYERTAHFILEIHERLGLVGLAGETSVAIPLTQEIMADALGLSVVHLNRTLQQLRRTQLIEFKGGLVRLLEPERLREIANFRAPRVTLDIRAAA